MRLPELNEIHEMSNQDLQVHASETVIALGQLGLLLAHLIEELEIRKTALPSNVMEYQNES